MGNQVVSGASLPFLPEGLCKLRAFGIWLLMQGEGISGQSSQV